jgi:uncharacterized protein
MNENQLNLLSPVNSKERVISIDVLRGVAVLGILVMNIQNFSMPGAAYMNPTAYGDLTGINKLVWILSHILTSGKFMSIFSMLFGAGILLFTDKAISKGRRSGPVHYRRMMWLLLFGLLHAYLLWHGDILVAYSLCGMLAFVFRKKSPKKLAWISLVFFVVPSLIYMLFYFSLPYWPEEALNNMMQTWSPDDATILKEITAMQGSWIQQMEIRAPMALFMQTGLFLMGSSWIVLSMMLLGMALYKWKIMSAERSVKFYTTLAIFGLFVGYSLAGIGAYLNFSHGWELRYSMFLGGYFNYVGSVAVALGYIAIVMIICKSVSWGWFKNLFASVGKMAFTNYILMTLIATFIFYGHGLGLFGEVDRIYQLLITFGVWVIILIISPIWLKYYRFGPLEWLWRSLTYWKRQPLRKAKNPV